MERCITETEEELDGAVGAEEGITALGLPFPSDFLSLETPPWLLLSLLLLLLLPLPLLLLLLLLLGLWAFSAASLLS